MQGGRSDLKMIKVLFQDNEGTVIEEVVEGSGWRDSVNGDMVSIYALVGMDERTVMLMSKRSFIAAHFMENDPKAWKPNPELCMFCENRGSKKCCDRCKPMPSHFEYRCWNCIHRDEPKSSRYCECCYGTNFEGRTGKDEIISE